MSSVLASLQTLVFYLQQQMMTGYQANSSTFVWNQFDFDLCNNHEDGMHTWAFFSNLCSAVGFPASVAILWEMLKIHRRGTPFKPNDFFILNLSIMDVVFLMFIPAGIINHFAWKVWVFEAFFNAIYSLNTFGRPLLMACICLDCYVAVVHPVTYLKSKSLAPRVVMVSVVWSLTAVTAVAYFLFYKLFFSFFPIIAFVIAIVIVGVCDYFIIHALVKSDPGRKNIHPQKKRALQTLIYSLAMTVFSYLPPVVLYSLGRILADSFEVFVCTFAVPVTLTSTVGSAVMPLLYLYNVGKLDCFKHGKCKLLVIQSLLTCKSVLKT